MARKRGRKKERGGGGEGEAERGGTINYPPAQLLIFGTGAVVVTNPVNVLVMPSTSSPALSRDTPCVRVPKCSAGAPVTAGPSRSRCKPNVDPRKLH